MKVTRVTPAGKKPHLQITVGACSAKIYSATRLKRGQQYPEHTLTYIEAGKRVRRVFSDLADAKNAAELALTKLGNGQTQILALTNTDRENYVLAMDELRHLNVPLLAVAREYRAAHELLGGRTTINEAVRYFVANGAPDIQVKGVSEVFKEMLEAKKADGASDVYQTDLELRLKRFVDAFPGPISEVTTKQIEDWLRGLKTLRGNKTGQITGPRNRNNFARVITSLFRFAKRAGYLPRDRSTAADLLAKAKVKEGAIAIFTPDETRRLLTRLHRFRDDLLPFAAIGAFAGLRTAEIARLDWEDIKLDQGHILVSADKAKTAQRRLVPIQPNLAKWLASYRDKKGKAAGKVAPLNRTNFAIAHAVAKQITLSDGEKITPIKWKRNALRHSFGSYRLAACKSAAEVALEMGNSPRMIFQHYRELVTPAEAKAYWSIEP